ncbi:MAG: tetratricopeptide repeat protein [Kiritimatiellia bacterium]
MTLEALHALAEWWAAAPSDVRPAEHIADVLIRLGHKAEALDFLRQALELDPARETLALRLSDLLQELGRAEEARTVLNDYVQLHPDSPALLLAQADWLRNRSRMAEAAERAARVIDLDPGNLRALLILLAGQSAAERGTNTVRLLKIAATPGSERPFLEAVDQAGLLSMPGPEPLWSAVVEACARVRDPKLTEQMNLVKPAPASLPTGFAGDKLDPAWELRDATPATATPGGGLDLKVKPELREFSLRMRPSSQWLDGFIETEVGGLTGGLWLVARKSVDHVVRFGFDRQEGRVFLQTWTGGGRTLLANQRFDLPPDFFSSRHVYRLECRGRGVQAFLDGVALARVPEALPSPWEGGACGLVVRADEPGEAAATISRLSCASVLPRVTLLPGEPGEGGGEIPPDQARLIASVSSALSPRQFTAAADGTFTSAPGPADDFIRLLARYHKLHYMPGITCTNAALPSVEALADLAGIHAADGFVLHVDTAPPAEWLAAARGLFLARGAGLVCVLRKPGESAATLYTNFGPGLEHPPLNARVVEDLNATPAPEPLDPVLYIVKEKT